jgi:hypothetical protein
MTYQNPEMARGARTLKAVAVVVALFALTLAGVCIALAPRSALPEVLLVAAGTFGIAVYMWAYATRPGMFTGDEGVFEDPLRTTYSVPERDAADSLARPWKGSKPISSTFPVSEHVYQWQSVRRVADGERVWTAAYVRLLLAQAGLVVMTIALVGAVVCGVTLGLGESVGAMWFVAAAIILPVGFGLSHRSGVVDSRDYPTEPMAPLPDLTWTPHTRTAAVVAPTGAGERKYAA